MDIKHHYQRTSDLVFDYLRFKSELPDFHWKTQEGPHSLEAWLYTIHKHIALDIDDNDAPGRLVAECMLKAMMDVTAVVYGRRDACDMVVSQMAKMASDTELPA